ncbi:lipoprotein [Geoanaerobacter pelophilus]|uniref:Lipoprotein n=1 Tax=Geoanaerobacter pelophilus TaxID=60036 RepID=A0ABQ0MJT4_9BACT|nr:lipoprotein [Geoanaerobacter pelophilus]
MGGCLQKVMPVLLLLCAVFFGGCTSTRLNVVNAPPVLTQDELLRPYYKVGNIQVRRSRYGSQADMTPADYSWAYDALRAEAQKIGADAVILPEVSVERNTYIFYPVSEMTAKGVAVKFR